MLLRFTLLLLLFLTGCSDTKTTSWTRSINQLCENKPNCVSTIEKREQFSVEPFLLTTKGEHSWEEIKQVALQLPGAKIADQSDHYLHIEATSKVFRFIDDFEVEKKAEQLQVRSASRVGYSDFGVNRKRVETFRNQLIKQELIKQ
ncbi:DUF1499 domain-containing protein [Photobacterium angustum]|uniref:DUF1499 domain-containing protein n=1 Tax=Photobacterium angustum TaxID=661 RepID=UPI0005E497ED|nr:DUF1499 domain-containing protein [Photobacterium angustum]KJG25903.1 hypothetical protein UA39_03640 [Photobacterium angustum]KJG34086.1 hypothetical protein UA36_03690 [Photobacterium angustum]PSW94778.1 DUF1499 domain-containing protein [Photobacterium angustum]PSX04508.1 DUF1499 domain-containing protein [Photobacterium angustum]PSX37641.1 DUF1499 domain-containing protein [Photobacterium angustum]